MAKIDELRQSQEEWTKKRREIVALLESEGWKTVELALTAMQQNLWHDFRARRITSIDTAFAHASMQGEMEGVAKAKGYPNLLIGDIDATLLNIMTEIEEEQRDEE